jgi:hypothetical protein
VRPIPPPYPKGLHIDFANAEMCPVPGSKDRKLNRSTLKVEFKRARLTMRGEGKAVYAMLAIALIYCLGPGAFLSGLAWLVREVRALLG